ncbi:MAG: hypothetical protein JKY18_03145 [Flavobacteriales bacterium]|nr:hypothetical protein [Flavobacteriales bacterium]PCH84795.1 MAG: hypothetical protein COB88_10990 [Flavobacteriales bacterium]
MQTETNRTIALGIILFGMLVFSSCSSLPSEGDAQLVFENRWRKKIDEGVLRINSFEKVNGQESEVSGVQIYEIEYQAEIEYLKDNKPDFLKKAVGTNKGNIKNPTGKIRFEKTEKGWKGQDGNIY